MYIKIVKCSHKYAWYEDHLGEIYKVSDTGGETGDSYGVAIDSIRKFWYIPFEDCSRPYAEAFGYDRLCGGFKRGSCCGPT